MFRPAHTPIVSANATPREIDIASDALPLEASLRDRLDMWKNAPGGRGEVEGEVELGGFVSWNLEVSSPGSKITASSKSDISNVIPSMNSTTLT